MFTSAVEPAFAAAQQNYRIYAGIVVDAKSGKVMYEHDADDTRYPASISKVMTLYILFQELAAGNIKLSTKMTVSKHAASAEPTKLGLKAGSTITVDDAIKAIITISANDMARVVAEAISGSEDKFAARMTATAHALGMTHTHYNNASGLPDAGQITTVRDQAVLAIAIYQHFPKYYDYFHTRSFKYGKRTYGSHVPLLGVAGVEGLKTGYINNSGYNVMTVSRKDDRHLVVIGFGFNSTKDRNNTVYSLLQKYLPKSREGGYLQTAMIPQPGMRSSGLAVQVAQAEEPTFVTPMPLPSFRVASMQQDAAPQVAVAAQPVQQPQVAVASLEAPRPTPQQRPTDLTIQPAVQAANMLGAPSAVKPVDRPVDVIGAWLSETFSLGAPPAPLGQTRPSDSPLPPVGVDAGGQPVDLMTSGAIAKKVASNDTASKPGASNVGGWVVQIGAAPDENGAAQLLDAASSRVTNLADFRPYVERFDKNGQTFYRARYVGFGGRDDATRMCSQIKQANLSCLAMQS
jgi:D-alanyl-D-alanine carboxypeptidase